MKKTRARIIATAFIFLALLPFSLIPSWQWQIAEAATWTCPTNLTRAPATVADDQYPFQCNDSSGRFMGYAIDGDLCQGTLKWEGQGTPGALRAQCVDSQGKATVADRVVTAACNKIWHIFSPVCIGRAFSLVTGYALITATAWLLAVAGYIFNFFIDHTIVNFGSLFDENAKNALTGG